MYMQKFRDVQNTQKFEVGVYSCFKESSLHQRVKSNGSPGCPYFLCPSFVERSSLILNCFYFFLFFSLWSIGWSPRQYQVRQKCKAFVCILGAFSTHCHSAERQKTNWQFCTCVFPWKYMLWEVGFFWDCETLIHLKYSGCIWKQRCIKWKYLNYVRKSLLHLPT